MESKINKKFDTIIIGAGLSGLSAGINLAEKNQKVLILESRSILGGRTSSWNQDGMEVESGLHRYLGFYTDLPKLIRTAGVEIDDIVEWTNKAEFRISETEKAIFSLAPFAKPLKTIESILANQDYLSTREKTKIGKFFVKGYWQYLNSPKELDSITVYELAKKQNFSQQLIKKILVPLTEGLFFLPIKEYSSLNFFGLFAPYWKSFVKTRVGAFKGGMSQVLIEPLAKYFVKSGGHIQINSPVTQLIKQENTISSVKTQTTIYKAKNIILATSLAEAQKLLQPISNNSKYFKDVLSLETMPSVTVQIETTKPVYDQDHVIFGPGTSLASFAEESRTVFPNSTGRLSVILSNPQKNLSVSRDDLLNKVIQDLKALGFSMELTQVKDFRIVSWENDFYSYKPGNYYKRPKQKTPISGLILAGDYTKQPYLQTMEGAVVSGQKAARLCIKN